MATTKTKASGIARTKNTPESETAAPLQNVGLLLREAREARELTLENVADELMIRKYYLAALEEGNYNNLPERVYAVGFVQNYLHLLGMDSEGLTEQFKREAYGGRGAATARVELNMPMAPSQSMLPSRPAIFAVGGLLLILIIGGIIWSSRAPEKTATSIPQPPVSTDIDTPAQPEIVSSAVPAPVTAADPGFAAPIPDKTSIVSGSGTVTTTNPADVPAADAMPPANAPAALPVDANAAVVPAPAAAPAATAPAGTRVMIEALQPSWVEIADAEGNILYTNILRVGQALPIPNKPGFTLTTGNAAGIQIVLDGQKLGPLGRKGEVKRSLTLNPDSLSKR